MTRSKFFGLALAAMVMVTLLSSRFLFAQVPVSVAITDDTGISFLVRYVGSDNSATVAVAAGGDITFQSAAAAHTGFECPISGALGGIIDVSDAACDTLGEVVDTINGNCTGCTSPGDFRAVLIDSFRTDTSDNTLVTIGASQVTRTDGLQINIDTSVALVASYALLPSRTDISVFLSGPPNYNALENPAAGLWMDLKHVDALSTFASGTSNLFVYSVKSSNKPAGSETVTTLWGPEAGGATTATKSFTQWQVVLLPGRQHEKMIVRLTNSAAMASTGGFASGQLR